MKKFVYSLSDLEIVAVSQVDCPAIEESTEFFDSQDYFQSTQTHIVGPAVIAGKPILRVNRETGEKYEIVFTPEVCDHLTKQILSRGLPLSAQHNGVLLPAVLTGCFQVSPITPYRGLPDHSIVLCYEASPETIEYLKSFTGFSVEILFTGLVPLPEDDDFASIILNSLS